MIASAKVTAVIVTYQSRGTIALALDALRRAYDSGLAECVVVDNASSDGTADFVAESYPWVTLVRSAENLGFGRGCNLGFRSVASPYVLFLNPDAAIGLQSLQTLIHFMDAHERAGIAGPATLTRSGDLHWAGLLLTPVGLIRSALRMGTVYADGRAIQPGEAPFRTSWICGAVMLIRSRTFRDLEGFDPRFFLYYEETDLCLRTVRSGMEIWAIGEATAEHAVGVSAKQAGKELSSDQYGYIVEHFFPSRYYYLVKNFGWLPGFTAELICAGMERARWVAKALLRRTDARQQRNALKRPILRMPAKSKE